MPPGSHAGEYTATKVYCCKKQTLKAEAEQYHTAHLLFSGQIFWQQLRGGKGFKLKEGRC